MTHRGGPSPGRGQTWIVLGLGRFGGGAGAARWLAGQGARVVVTDAASAADLSDATAALRDIEIDYALGGHPEHLLDEATAVVVNPAVDRSVSPFVAAARQRGIPLRSEIGLFLERCPGSIIGVTGTVGKSTTCAMITTTLRADRGRRVWCGGNIGVSLLGDLATMTPGDDVVLELSSFQLEDLEDIPWAPAVTVLTTLMPQHLERHRTFDRYVAAKLRMTRRQADDAVCFLTRQASEALAALGASVGVVPRQVIEPAVDLAGTLRVPGTHQLQNAALALAVAAARGVDLGAARAALQAFDGLPHRYQLVRTFDGVHYVNDSKATTPEAAMTALSATSGGMVLLAGGADRDRDLAPWAAAVCRSARAVICFGSARVRLSAALRAARGTNTTPAIKTVHDFGGGIRLAQRLARPGDTVLLAPGCPSYDAYANYEQRGDHFRDEVTRWVAPSTD